MGFIVWLFITNYYYHFNTALTESAYFPWFPTFLCGHEHGLLLELWLCIRLSLHSRWNIPGQCEPADGVMNAVITYYYPHKQSSPINDRKIPGKHIKGISPVSSESLVHPQQRLLSSANKQRHKQGNKMDDKNITDKSFIIMSWKWVALVAISICARGHQ